MAATITSIDLFSLWVGRLVAWLCIPVMLSMVYEVVARYAFTAPTIWAYDLSRMLYGAHFMLGAAYGLSKGLHIRSDFLYQHWSVKTQGCVDAFLFVTLYFPTMLIFTWVSFDYAFTSMIRWERGMDTAWMPYLGPVKSCIPIAGLFLVIQGVSELLKSLYMARTGRKPRR